MAPLCADAWCVSQSRCDGCFCYLSVSYGGAVLLLQLLLNQAIFYDRLTLTGSQRDDLKCVFMMANFSMHKITQAAFF